MMMMMMMMMMKELIHGLMSIIEHANTPRNWKTPFALQSAW
jgi:hypothetical protein